jgi:hypothetical protein
MDADPYKMPQSSGYETFIVVQLAGLLLIKKHQKGVEGAWR